MIRRSLFSLVGWRSRKPGLKTCLIKSHSVRSDSGTKAKVMRLAANAAAQIRLCGATDEKGEIKECRKTGAVGRREKWAAHCNRLVTVHLGGNFSEHSPSNMNDHSPAARVISIQRSAK
jgi:hypothetical protein